MKDKFIKNGVFSLEYDKETLRDMVLELQEENQELKAELQLYQGALKREHEAIHKVNDLGEVIDKIDKYINDYNVFEVFSFPLMKRWEEEQVKTCIDYEFKTSLIKDLKDILKEVE